jgi:hypothetical protein
VSVSATKEHHVSGPQDYNQWVIPAGVLITITLWIAVVVLLATDKDPALTTDEVALFGAAQIATISSVLYAKEYAIHRSAAADHQLLRVELASCEERTREQIEELRAIAMEFRGRAVVAAGETRSELERLRDRQTASFEELAKLVADIRQLYWQNLADGITNGADVGGTTVPFRRRH